MPESYAQVAVDQGGRKIHTRQRVIGANTVEEQYVIAWTSDRVLSGRFFAHSGRLSVQAAADTPPAGRFFLFNPVGSAVMLAVRRVEYQSQQTAVFTAASSPRIALKTFSATGTASGAAITARAHDTVNDAAQTAKLVTASTGLTITDGVIVKTFLPTMSMTAVGIGSVSEEDWTPDPAYPLILRAGEGLYCTQPDAGTTSDSRLYVLDITFDEFTWP